MSDTEALRHLAVLGLAPGASIAEVRQAYRDLANVWHPDRFGHSPRLQEKGQEKLKEINAAYTWLLAHPDALAALDSPPAAPPAGGYDPGERAARRLPAPLLLTLAVVALTFVGAFLLDSRRRARLGPQPPAVPVDHDQRVGESPARIATPPRWPWRGLTIGSATGAVPDDLARVRARLGRRFNYVRLTLDSRLVAEHLHASPDTAWSTMVAWADSMLDGCRDVGVVCTLTLNQAPPDTDDPRLTEASPRFWDDTVRVATVADLAGSLAERFGRRGAELGGYELLPKPLVIEGHRATLPPAWPVFVRQAVAAIRRHDADRWIMIAAGHGGLATAYRTAAPVDDPRVIYTATMYAPPEYTRQGLGRWPKGPAYPGMIGGRRWDASMLTKFFRSLRAFQERHGVPVLIDELGVVSGAPGATAYLSDLGRLFADWGWGWSYFGYGEAPPWNPDYQPDSTAGPARRADEDSERWAALRALFATSGGRLD